MKRLIPLFGLGIALGFIYMTFEPVIGDYIYFPLYEAIWFGLGVGMSIALTCMALCGLGLYIFLKVTEPRGAKR